MTDYYKQDGVEKWRFEELNHGLSMEAKRILPAGSMLNLSSPEDSPFIVPRFLYRED